MTRAPAGVQTAGSSSGFTLIELLITLAIVAGLAVLALPRLGNAKARVSLHSFTMELAAELRAARSTAQWSNAETSVSIDLQNRAFWSDVHAGRQSIPEEINIEISGAGIVTAAARQGRVRFRPDGNSGPGRIALKDGKRSAVLTVDGLTGATDITWVN